MSHPVKTQPPRKFRRRATLIEGKPSVQSPEETMASIREILAAEQEATAAQAEAARLEQARKAARMQALRDARRNVVAEEADAELRPDTRALPRASRVPGHLRNRLPELDPADAVADAPSPGGSIGRTSERRFKPGLMARLFRRG